jgi:hypothetical protein
MKDYLFLIAFSLGLILVQYKLIAAVLNRKKEEYNHKLFGIQNLFEISRFCQA